MGGTFKREQTYVYLWLIHADVWQKPNTVLQSNYPPIKNNKIVFTKNVTVLSKDEMALLHSSLFKSYQQFGNKFWKCHQRKKKGKPVWQG